MINLLKLLKNNKEKVAKLELLIKVIRLLFKVVKAAGILTRFYVRQFYEYYDSATYLDLAKKNVVYSS